MLSDFTSVRGVGGQSKGKSTEFWAGLSNALSQVVGDQAISSQGWEEMACREIGCEYLSLHLQGQVGVGTGRTGCGKKELGVCSPCRCWVGPDLGARAVGGS